MVFSATFSFYFLDKYKESGVSQVLCLQTLNQVKLNLLFGRIQSSDQKVLEAHSEPGWIATGTKVELVVLLFPLLHRKDLCSRLLRSPVTDGCVAKRKVPLAHMCAGTSTS